MHYAIKNSAEKIKIFANNNFIISFKANLHYS